MPTLSITDNSADGQAFTHTLYDETLTSIETFINTTKLDNANIQTGGIATANLASACVDENKLAASVAGAGLAGGAGTALAVNVDSSTIEISSDTLRVKDGGITQAKRAALGQQVSSPCTTYSNSTTTMATVTNLTLDITTTGRPVFVGLQSSVVSSVTSTISGFPLTSTSGGFWQIRRDGTVITSSSVQVASGSTYVPPGVVWFIDTGASAGTHTYDLQVAKAAGLSSIELDHSFLVAYEL
jgi:hypothetical protein